MEIFPDRGEINASQPNAGIDGVVPETALAENQSRLIVMAYVFGETTADTAPDASLFTPENFFSVLNTLVHAGDDRRASHVLTRFIDQSNIEYTEIDESKIENTNLLQTIEIEISKFIEDGEKFHHLAIIGAREAQSLNHIYNRQNLLAFAQATGRRSQTGLNGNALESVYRYRVIVKRIEEELDRELQTQSNRNFAVNARGWAGRVREYGVDSGQIDCADFRQFSGLYPDESRLESVNGIAVWTTRGKNYDE